MGPFPSPGVSIIKDASNVMISGPIKPWFALVLHLTQMELAGAETSDPVFFLLHLAGHWLPFLTFMVRRLISSYGAHPTDEMRTF